MKSSTITINGRAYDAVTGMPVVSSANSAQSESPRAQTPPAKPAQTAPRPAAPPLRRAFTDISAPQKSPSAASQTSRRLPTAHAIHQAPQKSQTLHRAALKKPAAQPAQTHHRSPAISKFGSALQPQATAPNSIPQTPTEQPQPPVMHPIATKAIANQQKQQSPAVNLSVHAHQQQAQNQVQESKTYKEQLIKERLDEMNKTQEPENKPKKRLFARRPRLAAVLTSSLAILLLGGYLTYINLPNISMRVAATRAGVAATFPGYHPDGYNVSGPITYSPGEVTISYKSNTDGRTGFSIAQKTSSWDSQAVLENYVSKQTESPTTQQEGGLTIYSFGTNSTKAAWVNGGILYTIDGNAQLSNDQLQKLATSM